MSKHLRALLAASFATVFAAPMLVPTSTYAAPTSATPPRYTLSLIATGYGSPDDLVVTPSGDIIFGDFSNKALNIIRGGSGSPVPLAKGIAEPEGIVVAKDGALIVADQATNRMLEINPSTGAQSTLRYLTNNTKKEGVDGLGLDPATGDILIPDSPNGRLLRMSRDGSRLQTIATGFVRPTGAAVEHNGTIVVVDEFGNAVYRLNKNGSRTRIARIYQPDDVVIGQDGSIYVNNLGGNVSRIDPVTLKLTVLTSGLKLPHGIGIDPQGNVVVAEAGRNRIFKLVPAR